MEVSANKVMNNKRSEKNEEDEEGTVLPGFRFHPTDEELVGFYLRRKVEKKPLRIQLIKHIDIYKYDPWDLPKEAGSNVGEKEKEWYFFCKRGRKYRNSVRPNRVTGSGFWKATGIDKPIHTLTHPHHCIGLKKSLVYYRGSAGKGSKTDWMMHEFRLPPPTPPSTSNSSTKPDNLQEAEVWTLCRIFKRIPSYRKYTPTLKDTKPNPSDSSNSKTCSLESDNNNNNNTNRKPNFGSFRSSDSLIFHQQNSVHERKPVLDERSHLFLGQLAHHQAAPTMVTNCYNPTFLSHQSMEDVFANGDWDELRSVVQFANIDPSTVYDCTGLDRLVDT